MPGKIFAESFFFWRHTYQYILPWSYAYLHPWHMIIFLDDAIKDLFSAGCFWTTFNSNLIVFFPHAS